MGVPSSNLLLLHAEEHHEVQKYHPSTSKVRVKAPKSLRSRRLASVGLTKAWCGIGRCRG